MILLGLSWDGKGEVRTTCVLPGVPTLPRWLPNDCTGDDLQEVRISFANAVDMQSLEELKKAGERLIGCLLAPDVAEMLFSQKSDQELTLQLSSNLVDLPVELMCRKGEFLGDRFLIGRTVSETTQKWTQAKRTIEHSLQVLIVSNPAQDGLPNADDEAQAVFDVLARSKDVSATLLTGAREVHWLLWDLPINRFDLVLYIGHSTTQGWPFAGGKMLTANMLQARAVSGRAFPAGIIANSCRSASSVTAWQEKTTELCQAFLRSGAGFYIGTLWDIPDDQAGLFSRVFFDQIIRGSLLAEAMRSARQALQAEFGMNQLIWAAYVLYGSPDIRLLPDAGIRKKAGRYALGDLFLQDATQDYFLAEEVTKKEPVVAGMLVRAEGCDPRSFDALQEVLANANACFPRIKECGKQDDRIYLVYDPPVPQSTSLHSLIETQGSQPLPAQVVTGLLVELCDALEPLHRQGWFHGELSPEYIRLIEPGPLETWRLSQVWGMGVRQALHSAQVATEKWSLSRRYTAPEQFRQQEITGAADVFALGVLAYRLLTGKDLSMEDAESFSLERAQSVRALAHSDLPPRLMGLLLQALNSDPLQRITVGALKRALRELDQPDAAPVGVSEWVKELTEVIWYERSLIWLSSYEEERALSFLRQAAQPIDPARDEQPEIYQWSAGLGLVGPNLPVDQQQVKPEEVLLWFSKLPADRYAMLVLKDFHPYLDNPAVRRQLIILYEQYRSRQMGLRALVCLSPLQVELGEDLERRFHLIELDPPGQEEVAEMLSTALELEASPENMLRAHSLAWVALGLSQMEIQQAIACYRAQDEIAGEAHEHQEREGDLPWDYLLENDPLYRQLLDAKRNAVLKTNLLDFEMPALRLRDIGGLADDNLKHMVEAVRPAINSLGFIPLPKGWLFSGVPGSGKSMAVRAVAGELQLPLLRLDMGRLFGGFLGDSEQNTYRVLSICDQLSPLILWIDELEKGIAGSEAGGGGAQGRIMSILLHWMQEHANPVLVIATANQLSGVSSEWLRAGRFDAVLFFDTPNNDARRQVLELLFSRYHLNGLFKEQMDDFTRWGRGAVGAELEQVIVNALYHQAADSSLEFSEHLRRSFDTARPLWRENTSHGRAENEALRNAAKAYMIEATGWYTG